MQDSVTSSEIIADLLGEDSQEMFYDMWELGFYK